MPDALIYCWRSGEIEVGTVEPEGAITLARGELRALHAAVAGTARLAYDGKTWLVPGVPEAADDDDAWRSARAYRTRLELSLKRVREEAAG